MGQPLRVIPALVRLGGRRLTTALGRPEGFAIAVLLADLGILTCFGSRLPFVLWVMLWAMAVVTAVVPLPRGLIWLAGPLLFYDLLRTARRGRYVLLRCIYGSLLLATLIWLYLSWFAARNLDLLSLFASAEVENKRLSNFASSFFSIFMGVQFAAVLLLTPAYAAGAIAEEKERRTLEFLFATGLSDREIIWCKLIARCGNMLLLMLTGLPILAVMQFLGGVDPNLVLAGFAATGMTILSLASASLVASIRSDKTLDAMSLTYLWVLMFLVVSAFPCLNYGNPIVALVRLNQIWEGQAGQGLTGVLAGYTLVHGVIALVACTWATHKLRSAGRERGLEPIPTHPLVQELSRDRESPPSPVRRRIKRPPIGANALLWKECYAEQEFSFRRLSPGIFALASTAAGLLMLMLATYVLTRMARGQPLGPDLNSLMRAVGVPLACLMLLAVAFSAAGSVSRERERQTLESLLTIPEERETILWAKWLGSILSARWAWWALGTLWGVGLLTGGLHLLALPSLLMAWLAYATFVAGLGLWFSLVSRSTMQASLRTVVALLVICLVSGLLGVYGDILTRWLPSWLGAWVSGFQQFGVNPPATLWVLTSYSDGSGGIRAASFARNPGGALLGVLAYGAAAWGLYVAARARFRREKGPLPDKHALECSSRELPAPP
jgi:ABC-type transport system involved in multi-copper enzyme maturation permease subunit